MEALPHHRARARAVSLGTAKNADSHCLQSDMAIRRLSCSLDPDTHGNER
jgi:hypothetical protein